MSDDAGRALGVLIKRYVRAKWRGPDSGSEVERIGQQLDAAVRSRVDAIGMDDQELLHVADDAVLTHLAELEREAERELTRALNGARVVRKRTDERAATAKSRGRHRRVH